MIRTILAGSAIALLSIAEPADAAEQRYDCDTTVDHYSELEQGLPGPGYDASGTITAVKPYVGDRHLAAGRVALESADGKSFLSFRLTHWPKTDEKTMGASLMIQIDGKEEEIALGRVNMMKPVPFALHVDAAGDASLTLGEWHRDLKVPLGSAAVASASCSTGEFLFEHLKLGG